ncbi:MAG: hypothetical protein EXR75_06300 [Myxococcales bacterium]|nr:hypothetical protein [Myxococcales bacterium]
MKKHATNWVCTALGVFSLGLGAGCTENNVTLYVRHVPIADVEDKCTVSADPGGPALLGGILDKSLTTEYSQVFLVANQLMLRGDPDTLRPESSRVTMFEAEVTVIRNDGATLASFSVPVAGFAEEAQGTSPGFGVIQVSPVIDSLTVGARLDPANPTSPFLIDTTTGGSTVIARIRLFGRSLGGTDVETGDYDLPVFVCGASGSTPSTCIPTYAPEDLEDPILSPCRRGQDVPHDCRMVNKELGLSGATSSCP